MIADDMMTYIKNDIVVFGIGVFLFMGIIISLISSLGAWSDTAK